MAVESIGLNDPGTVKQYSRDLLYAAKEATFFSKFMGTDDSALIHEKTETSKGSGDRVTCYLSGLLEGDGVSGSDVLEGSEEASQTFTDSMIIDELRHAARVKGPGTIEQQRVPRDLRDTAYNQLKDWWARRMDVSLFNQLAGNTAQTDTKYTGMQAATAPTTGRHFWVDVSASNNDIISGSNDQTVGASATDILTINGVRALKNIATQTDSSGNFRMRPIMVGGKPFWVLFVHNNQLRDLKNDTSTVGGWYDIHQALLQGGDILDNPIFTGAEGVVDGVIIHSSENVPRGVHSSTGAEVANTRRAVLCKIHFYRGA